MWFMSLLLPLAASAATTSDTDDLCVYPGTCQAPDPDAYKYISGRLTAVPRDQWVDSGGFCGAVSIQTLALTYGAYISQDLIRKAAPDGGGHGDEDEGYEISTTNIGAALDNLQLLHEAFDENTPKPQGRAYLAWMKKQLTSNFGIVQFVICQGDGHNVAPDGEEPIVFDHIEPFFKLYSQHPPTDETVYPDDVVVHASDYGPDGEDNFGYFREFSTLLDTTDMEGNCAEAGDQWKQNEMFPCIYFNETYGTAIQGVKPCNKGSFKGKVTVPVNLLIDSISEPDLRSGAFPVEFHGSLVIENNSSAKHTCYR